jgi:signal transduction histidine kinase
MVIPSLVFNIQVISLFITGLVNLILVVIVSLRPNKTQDTKFFVAFSTSVFAWVASRLVFEVVQLDTALVLSAQFLYLAAIYIPLSLVYFIDAYPKNKITFSNIRVLSTVLPATIASIITIIPGLVIESVSISETGVKIIHFGDFYPFYFLYILVLFIVGLSRMGIKLIRAKGIERSQLEIVFVSILVSASVGVLANLILPSIGIFDYFWVGPLFSVFMVVAIGYAITKYQLFDTKLFTTEVLTFLIWAVILTRVLTSTSVFDRALNLGMLLITIIIGIYLIKSVVKEIAQREHIEKLARDLTVANDRLKDLDEQKTEFVSLASHQLRGPLTAIKGYGSMLLEGDFGELSPMIKDAVEKMYKSTNDLVVIVGDYLDVSRIEQGRMQYDFSRFDLKELISTVANELKPTVENAHLTLDFDASPAPNYMIHADKGKIKQVISNIVDNAIKYTPQGGLHIWLSGKPGNKALITISDTGVGIHPDVIPKLFQKFSRAPNASKTNILGTGLGLYVARKMIEAHNGRVWAESSGQGKGSTFFIELDLVG